MGWTPQTATEQPLAERWSTGARGGVGTQVATVVRDDPAEAIRALEALGYDVTLRPGVTEPESHLERLRAL